MIPVPMNAARHDPDLWRDRFAQSVPLPILSIVAILGFVWSAIVRKDRSIGTPDLDRLANWRETDWRTAGVALPLNRPLNMVEQPAMVDNMCAVGRPPGPR